MRGGMEMAQRAGAWKLAVVVAMAMVLWLGMVAFASAKGRDDHERARQAVEAGQVLPLKTVLARIEREYPGEVLEVELEQDDGAWRYELKLLQAGGVLLKLKVDARTGRVVRSRTQRGRDREHD